MERVAVGPEQQRRRRDPRVDVEQLAARADGPRARERRPRAGEVGVAADVGERVADEVARRRVAADAEPRADLRRERAAGGGAEEAGGPGPAAGAGRRGPRPGPAGAPPR